MPLNQAASTAASSGSVLYDCGVRRLEREVDDADVVVGLVVDGELEAVDHVEDGGVAGVVGRP